MIDRDELAERIEDTLAVLASRTGVTKPDTAVVLGSGFGAFADRLTDATRIAYADLPAFPPAGVGGHAGELLIGRLRGRTVAVASGRAHYYERGRPFEMLGAIRTLATLGCGMIVLTNAAGSLDPAMAPGSLMLIADHLNLPQVSPLFGEGDAARFVDMVDAYDPALRTAAKAATSRIGVELREGVYAWFAGPQFETPAEIRMARVLGADAVGMSTVPETIAARHAGLKVLGLSLITNLAAGLSAERLSHEHTLKTATGAAGRAADALEEIIAGVTP